ncbi:helix-turn-helix domain-containing protein [Flavobacterium sp. LS1R47]|uniref:Helix-turn-helix domain-containing protein n=1 Tax=Flavobacterium frigoritolerans TaxID=2987686 RepID=A0A9X3C647_9FLAO|nr:helix-turn-helix transcriptional regulator [Flavobacterium frigoritolerans]MCV9931499.1 helix-turn-helix domain-containing protein [Flavobacterium frigoritolerans]
MSIAIQSNHIGRKISRIRELKDMKQEALAQALGTSQQTVSAIENSETIDDEKLFEVAKALGVSPEAIKNFTEENMINYFNNFYDNSTANGINNPINCTFNPLDKVVELYERLVQVEKEKNEFLEKLLKEK